MYMSEVNASRRKFHLLYKTTCLITGRYYIGVHSTNDLNDGYLGSGKRLRLSIKKHGKANHRFEILEDCSDQGRKFLIAREKFVVNHDLLKDPLCMNLREGGNDAPIDRPCMEETRRKMSESAKIHRAWLKANGLPQPNGGGRTGQPHTPETKAKLSVAIKGKTKGRIQSPEERERRRQAQLNRSPEAKALTAQKLSEVGRKNKGKVLSEETRRQISESLTGNIPWNKGKTVSEEARRKMSESAQRRVQRQREAGTFTGFCTLRGNQ